MPFTRADLCACRVYQKKAQSFDETAARLADCNAQSAALVAKNNSLEGALRQQQRISQDALNALAISKAKVVALEFERDTRWSAWKSGALGSCLGGVTITALQIGLKVDVRASVGAGLITVGACSLAVFLE